MRVALVTHVVVPHDGQGRVVYELARSLSTHGHSITLYTHKVAPEVQIWPRVSVNLLRVGLNRPAIARQLIFASFATLALASSRHDVVHLNGAVAFNKHQINTCHMCHAGWLHFQQRQPSIRQRQTLYQRASTSVNALLERRTYLRTERAVIAVSERARQELINSVGLDPSRVHVIYHGVDTTHFRPVNVPDERLSTRRSLGLAAEDFAVLFVGDLRGEVKGVPSLLQAVRLASIANLKLLLVGDPCRSHIVQQVHALGLRDIVRVLGFVSDTAPIYRAADAFVLPSRYDSFGLVALEAMASGLPVVISAQAGASELIQHGSNGLIVPDTLDTHELAMQLRALAADARWRQQLGSAARTTAQEYPWSRMSQRVIALYQP